jgi:hypothetical protein
MRFEMSKRRRFNRRIKPSALYFPVDAVKKTSGPNNKPKDSPTVTVGAAVNK